MLGSMQTCLNRGVIAADVLLISDDGEQVNYLHWTENSARELGPELPTGEASTLLGASFFVVHRLSNRPSTFGSITDQSS